MPLLFPLEEFLSFVLRVLVLEHTIEHEFAILRTPLLVGVSKTQSLLNRLTVPNSATSQFRH